MYFFRTRQYQEFLILAFLLACGIYQFDYALPPAQSPPVLLVHVTPLVFMLSIWVLGTPRWNTQFEQAIRRRSLKEPYLLLILISMLMLFACAFFLVRSYAQPSLIILIVAEMCLLCGILWLAPSPTQGVLISTIIGFSLFISLWGNNGIFDSLGKDLPPVFILLSGGVYIGGAIRLLVQHSQ